MIHIVNQTILLFTHISNNHLLTLFSRILIPELILLGKKIPLTYYKHKNLYINKKKNDS